MENPPEPNFSGMEKLPMPVAALSVLHYPNQYRVLRLPEVPSYRVEEITDKQINSAARNMTRWWHPDRVARFGIEEEILDKVCYCNQVGIEEYSMLTSTSRLLSLSTVRDAPRWSDDLIGTGRSFWVG